MSVVLWTANENVWDYDEINSQIAIGLILPFNTLYYFY
jgi:hypothetical protein